MSQVEVNDLDKQLLSRVHPLTLFTIEKVQVVDCIVYTAVITEVELKLILYNTNANNILKSSCVDALHQMIKDTLILHPNTEMLSARIDQQEEKTVIKCNGYSRANFNLKLIAQFEEVIDR